MQTLDLMWIVLAVGVIQALLAWWIKVRLTASIKHEYDKKLEQLKHEHERREKAAVVAELLAEWTHVQGGDTKRLNQLLWELSLYLPSPLVRDVKTMVEKSPNGKTAPQVLVAVREHLLNGADPIREEDIAHFKHPQNDSMLSSSNLGGA